MSVTEIKKGIRKGRVGVMNSEGKRINSTAVTEPRIRE
jgi:hypothetical protein